MIKVSLPDGSVREYEEGASPFDVAKSISNSLAKKALAARVDGELRDLMRPLDGDAKVELVTANDAEGLELIRHDAAHVLAQAVQELYPDAQVTIGPVIDDGFYYDFAREEPFSTEDFEKIEKKMREIVDADYPIVRQVWDKDQAIETFKKIGEDYKAQIIDDIIPPGEAITVYKQGDWFDLCRGPHLPSTGKLPKAFKLMKLAGAYWRGDSKNEMLQRMYGTAWANEKDLKAHLLRLEEAEKRDHRKLATQLDLFHLDGLAAAGSIFWHPKGYQIWLQIESYMRRRLDAAGYEEIKTPQLMDSVQWEKSGHWGKYRENMFIVPDFIPEGDEGVDISVPDDAKLMALKPMNCPAHVEVFKQGQKSYRDLPLRLAEFGCCHRNEPHGALHGIMRVRQFTQDDAHIFCREDQIVEESIRFCRLLENVYRDFGFENIAVKLSTRPDVRAGDDATWDRAEKGLQDAVDAAGLPCEIMPGEGAFYGPKLEFQLTDAIGRVWQCGTLQLDYVLPERLGAEYTASDGSKQRPVMLHRAILGSMERFIGILIEEFSGAFPMWLSPVQVVVAAITDAANEYAEEAAAALRKAGLRVETDLRNEKINYKVREHSVQKVPIIAVVGGREAEDRTLALRRLGSNGQHMISLEDACRDLAQEALAPDLKSD
ncbi:MULTISPECIES: threonine--tRNA ligase [unclassified Hyphomonas]|mgnify:FL=1|jgi:threonyl-tRNA synthetase|uniref:threonine--tRNA ligase n=3 Tax=Hyphomonas TaxID=85 RepID=UPI000C4F34BF|nr:MULTISPECIES: threonine--tRNA ligase [unclassified Hyphomonas]MAL44847.1 threonine--tRNA ligase [Hyphomonas sp.]MAX83933.1 threonine--tRNA ligase [Hyphomonas sp.]HBT35844.1 threonine--tRNA ligase [Hyphomonas sp.]HBU34936.1 threonine--tRNA ligase [Hyphomonas sp.]|tara:strand:+ start:238 stop:2211 length:1974 start_codon:yes stop_codon:yes gene_type:complete